MASIAVFMALGGVTYAATALPKNSVGTKQIRKKAVTNIKLATNAVTGNKVKDGSLSGKDIKVSTLGKVPLAAAADTVGGATAA